MAKPKTYEITKGIYKWKKTSFYRFKGTLNELIEATRPTFELGHSRNPKINLAPKTIKSFASNYEKSLDEQQCCPVEVAYVEMTV